MHRKALLSLLSDYHATDQRDRDCREQFTKFVNDHFDCFERSLASGHLTGSAWIVNKPRSRFLLTYHKKLGLWLQLGGHADGETNLAEVALREAREESGLSEIKLLEPGIFDLDIHLIPQYRDVPQHLHYDVRFLCEADDRKPLSISDESHDLRWLSPEEISKLTQEESILRMLRKSPPPLNE
jgi:8-oxo-dGTP pyrophosphatase MutT (NUDIX family)